MELTLRERIALQRQVKENLDTLQAGVSNLRERIALQRKVKEDLDKLLGISTKAERTLLDRLLAGEFNSLEYMEFYEKLVEAVQQSGKEFSVGIEPAVNYLKAHFNTQTGMYENAIV